MDYAVDPQYKMGDGSALRVWRDTAKNNFQSEKLGRPVYDEVMYVEVISPGSSGSSPVFEVLRTFNAETSEGQEPLKGVKYDEYKAFIADFESNESSDASLSGTPLSEWSEISRSMAASLKASAVHTVEALASLPDDKLTLVGPDGRTWRAKAEAYLAAASNSAIATELAAKLEQRDQDVKDLQRQLTELSSKLDAQDAAKTGNIATVSKPAKGAAPADTGTIADIV